MHKPAVITPGRLLEPAKDLEHQEGWTTRPFPEPVPWMDVKKTWRKCFELMASNEQLGIITLPKFNIAPQKLPSQ